MMTKCFSRTSKFKIIITKWNFETSINNPTNNVIFLVILKQLKSI